jgi:RNA polymerase sigma-70 factor (ECF subfamily)
VLAFRKRQTRDRLVFDEELLGQITEEYVRQVPEGGEWSAMDVCLGKLTPTQRELIEKRYANGDSVNQIAATQGKPANAVSAMLYRLRALLADCIEKQRLEGGLA